MQLHSLQPRTKQSTKTRVGRGGKRGKTSGRGHKGQKARAGGTPRPVVRDIIKKIPKLRGHGKNRARTVNDSTKKPAVVNVAALEATFSQGDSVTPEVLADKKLITKRGGKIPSVKILGSGDISKKLSISGCVVSTSAREKIEKAGGTITE